MNRSGKWLLALVLVLVSGGCVTPPRLFHPGPAAYQQRKAERFDPYADNDIGPTVVGARPRDYDKPSAEPARAQPASSRWAVPNSVQ